MADETEETAQNLTPRELYDRALQEEYAQRLVSNQNTLFPQSEEVKFFEDGMSPDEIIRKGLTYLAEKFGYALPENWPESVASDIRTQIGLGESIEDEIQNIQNGLQNANTQIHNIQQWQTQSIANLENRDEILEQLHTSELEPDQPQQRQQLLDKLQRNTAEQIDPGFLNSIVQSELNRRAALQDIETLQNRIEGLGLNAEFSAFTQALTQVQKTQDDVQPDMEVLARYDQLLSQQPGDNFSPYYRLSKGLEEALPQKINPTEEEYTAQLERLKKYGDNHHDPLAARAGDAFKERHSDIPRDEVTQALFNGDIGLSPRDLGLVADNLILESIEAMRYLENEGAIHLLYDKWEENGRKSLSEEQIRASLSPAQLEHIGDDIDLINSAIAFSPYQLDGFEIAPGVPAHQLALINDADFIQSGALNALQYAKHQAINARFGELDDEHAFIVGKRFFEFEDLNLDFDYADMSYSEFKSNLTPDQLTQVEHEIMPGIKENSSILTFSETPGLTSMYNKVYHQYLREEHLGLVEENPEPTPEEPEHTRATQPTQPRTEQASAEQEPQRYQATVNGFNIPTNAAGETTQICQTFGAAVQSTEELSAALALSGRHACEESFRANAEEVTGRIEITETGPEAVRELQEAVERQREVAQTLEGTPSTP